MYLCHGPKLFIVFYSYEESSGRLGNFGTSCITLLNNVEETDNVASTHITRNHFNFLTGYLSTASADK